MNNTESTEIIIQSGLGKCASFTFRLDDEGSEYNPYAIECSIKYEGVGSRFSDHLYIKNETAEGACKKIHDQFLHILGYYLSNTTHPSEYVIIDGSMVASKIDHELLSVVKSEIAKMESALNEYRSKEA